VNVYLTGFMGAGKTTVGRRLARLLKRRFLDLDAEVERAAGRSIAAIFGRGEAAFRRLESAALRRAARRRGLVVALGGGALVDPASRKLAADTGLIVALTCAEAKLRQRLRRDRGLRPLLVRDPRQGLRRLLARRRGLYRRADLQVSTTRRPPGPAATLIARKLHGRWL